MNAAVHAAMTSRRMGRKARDDRVLRWPDGHRLAGLWREASTTGSTTRPTQPLCPAVSAGAGADYPARVLERPEEVAMSDYGGRMLVDRACNAVGKVVDVIAHQINLRPQWLVVRLGRFTGERFVPASTAENRDGHVVAPFSKEESGAESEQPHVADLVSTRRDLPALRPGRAGPSAAAASSEMTEALSHVIVSNPFTPDRPPSRADGPGV